MFDKKIGPETNQKGYTKMAYFDKFCLLMWKNYKLQKRKPFQFIFEIGIPLAVISLILFLRTKLPNDEAIYSFDIEDPSYYHKNIIAYAPTKYKKFNELMSSLFPDAGGFPTLEKMEQYLANTSSYESVGLYFPGTWYDDQKPSTLKFVLKYFDNIKNYHVNELWPGFSLGYGRRDMLSSDYFQMGFPSLQLKITKAILGKEIPNLKLQKFPYTSHDSFLNVLDENGLLSYLFVAAFVYASISIVKAVTHEKEMQLKESMKIMGLPTWLHWTAWFCQMFIPFSIVSIGFSIVMKYSTENGKILEQTNIFLLLIMFLLFIASLIMFCFALSTFFSKANRAASFTGIIWILTLVPYIIVRSKNRTSSPFKKYTCCLFPISALSFALDIIISFEAAHEGSNWSNFNKTMDNNITLCGVFMMMIFDILFYLLLALYVEAVFPGEFGVAQKFYFPFTKQFWCPIKKESSSYLMGNSGGEFFEEEPQNLKIGIQIKNLGKKFGSHEAVKSLNLNLYEDQITVLLGHNGAGKTTTMSMLTGMFSPSKGTAIVNGYDVRTDIMKVRDSMGLCLQHNVLFDDLTVREHLIFFSRLKGARGHEVNQEVNKYLNLLALQDKADIKSSALSGGMKRKLSTGIALCGKSKVIMLDEPTAGMDPSARRFIWEFLQKQKIGRTILLTTHFMDEADLLGDRIAIMSGGELQCCGSSFFLKKKYGTGYHLIIDKTQNCKPNDITNVLNGYIPGIKIESDAGTELTYLLPETHSHKFPEMLAYLERHSNDLGMRSYGISLTDLEEVFMKVGSTKHLKKDSRLLSNEENGNANVFIGRSNLEIGGKLVLNQIHAMFLKKLMVTKRTWLMELSKIVFPILAILLISYSEKKSLENESNSRGFELSDYDNPITLIDTNSKGAYLDEFQKMLLSLNQKIEHPSNISSLLIKTTRDDVMKAKYQYIVGASFSSDRVLGWYSGEPYHALPLIMQLLLNVFYQQEYGTDHWIKFEISQVNVLSDEEAYVISKIMGSLNILAFVLAISYICNFYILFNVRERVCKAKHLQYVSGVKIPIFWIVSFISDMLTYIIDCSIILMVVAVIKLDGINTTKDLVHLAFYLFTTGIGVIPWIYVFSYLFTVPSTGYSRSFMLSFILGFPACLVIMVLDSLKWKWSDGVKTILRLFPFYDFAQCINPLHKFLCEANQQQAQLKFGPDLENKTDCDAIFNFGEYGTGLEVIMMYVVGVACFLILFLSDYKILTNLTFWIFEDKSPPSQISNLDDDVEKEDNYVSNRPIKELQSNYVLVLKNLTKVYGWFFKKFNAVNGINLAVKRSECFGLLGVNGAGKTTTFKMMTGDEYISYGNGWINGFSIKTQMDSVQRFIGYCPQFDALLDNLTARETLKMFCLIRGVPRIDCMLTTEKLAKDFDFYEHLDKQVKALSGGNKRKLSTAIALTGDAPIIFLDEPSTGMDPATKRHLWTTLSKIRESGKSIVLTSHSMEECEALCTRLVIMVNGKFQCLGSIQHLKNKFAKGYTVTLKVKKTPNEFSQDHTNTFQIEQFMQRQFPNAVLKEKHQELLTYYICDNSLAWSKVFHILQNAKGTHNLEDYSVGQASLEQVFLSFTKNQISTEDPDEVRQNKKCCKLWCCC